MHTFNQEAFRAQQTKEVQAKVEQLQAETGKLMLELTTLYGNYATLLQENIRLRSRVGKPDPKGTAVAAR